MALRFRGLVKAARNCRIQMTVGIPESDRQSFFESVREVIDHVESVCKEHGVDVQDLPGPSRNAVADLQRILKTPPEQLSGPREDRQPAHPIRISYVVGGLNDKLEILANHAVHQERVQVVFEAICRSADNIEAICRQHGTIPAGMPQRSARAYAMTKWLSHRQNFDHYVSQVQLARGAFETVSSGGTPKSAHRVGVLFSPGRHLWKLRKSSHSDTWHLAVGFLNAGSEEIKDLAQVAVSRNQAPPHVRVRHQAFVDSPDFGELDQELDSLLTNDIFNPKGRAWNIDDLFAQLNEQFFEGRLSRPNLHWYHSVSRQCFGFYDALRDAVCLNLVLDDPELPEYVPAYVLYHELLHKKHGFLRSGARRLSHTPAFSDDLRRFPQKERAEHYLGSLASGWDPTRWT